MKTTLSFYKLQTDGDATIGTYEGVEHLVQPVVMMVEGVHHGSAGAIFHSIDELGRFPEAWNGIPVVVRHPQDDEGNYISANSPDVLANYKVGRIFHVKVDGKKLKGSAWINLNKLKDVSELALEKVNSKEIMEVSVGVFTQNEELETEQSFGDEKYSIVAHNHVPDHLALLPDEKGACSNEDGCGLGVNSQTKTVQLTVNEALKFLNKEGHFVANKQGYTIIMDSLRRLLDKMDNDDSYYYVEEIFDDYFIYVRSIRDAGSKMYKQGYGTVDSKVTLVGEPTEVTKKVEVTYEVVPTTNKSRRTVFNTNSKTKKNMENCAPCEKVNAIILHSGNAFSEADREFLMGLNAEQLEKFLPKETSAAPQANTSTDPLQALTAEQKAWMELGKKTIKEKREMLTKGIQDNASKELWPDDVLASMDEAMLQRVFDSLSNKSKETETEEEMDYSIGGGAALEANASAEIEPLYPWEVEHKK